MDKIPVVIISRQLLLRQGLASLLSSAARHQAAGEYGNLQKAFSETAELGKRILLVDAELPALESAEIIKASGSSKIIIIGSMYNKKRLMELMPLKADGYLTSDISWDEFMDLLTKVEQVGPVISESLIPSIIERLSSQGEKSHSSQERAEQDERYELLTPREREILCLLSRGHTNAQIADKLFISIYTAKNHVHNILDKLGVKNRARLVSYAVSKGLVSVLVVGLLFWTVLYTAGINSYC